MGQVPYGFDKVKGGQEEGQVGLKYFMLTVHSDH